MNRRALLGLTLGTVGFCLGICASLLSRPALGIPSALCALAAGGALILITERSRQKAEQLKRTIAERDAELRSAEDALSMVDPDTGLPGLHYFELAIRGRVASARRHLWPVSVVLLEIRLSPDADKGQSRVETLAAFTKLMRQTLREADIACRIGDYRFGLVLEDTSEEGGVWTAERLQIALTKDVAQIRRLAAGVASYPTHALEADDVMNRAETALQRACSSLAQGLGQVEVAHLDLS